MSGASSNAGSRKYAKYCIVPGCLNTSTKFPDKKFISVPKNETRRKAWLKAVRTTSTYSKTSNVLVCEDHFDLKEDAQNYLKLQFFPGQSIVIKEGVVPHIFHCQPDRKDVPDEENTDEGSIEESILPDEQWPASIVEIEMGEKNVKQERISDDEGVIGEENVSLAEPMCVLIEGNVDGESISREIIPDDPGAASSVEIDLGEKIEEERIPDEERGEVVNIPGASKDYCPPDNLKSSTDFGSTGPVHELGEANEEAMFESVFLVMPKIEMAGNEENDNGSTQSSSRSGQSSKSAHSVEEHLAIDLTAEVESAPPNRSEEHVTECGASNRTPGTNFPLQDDLKCATLESLPLPTGQQVFTSSGSGKKFFLAPGLSHHMYRTQTERAKGGVDCPVCGKYFPDSSHLRSHFRKHTGERPFVCPICEKRFSTSGNLKIHIRLHTGERPHVCSECNKGFPTRAALKSHFRMHTGEKPFVCPECNKRYPRIYELNTHIRTIHAGEKPFECPQCGKGVCSKAHLRTHIRSHTGEKPFNCPHCNGCFTEQCSLKKHISNYHTEKQSYVYLEDLKREDPKPVT